MGDAAIASLFASMVALVVGWLTARNARAGQTAAAEAAAKAAVKTQQLSSRTDIEKEAFERAKGFYTDTIDRQGAEIHELESDVSNLKARVRALEEEKVRDHRELEELRRELAIARRLLHQKYPDEP